MENSSSSSESDRCSICLGPFIHESYLDHCFHKFCFNCILHWTNVVSSKNSRRSASVKCPLCKTDNFSIVHDYDKGSFQQYYVNQDPGISTSSTFFSKEHKYRLQCYYIEQGALNEVFNVSKYWKSRKYLQPNKWLFSWLKREIQALLQEEDVDIIVHHILGLIESTRRNERKNQSKVSEQEEFEAMLSEAARRFIGGRTERFVKEVELFLASGLTIQAYDNVYIKHLSSLEITDEVEEEKQDDLQHQNTPLVPYLYILDDDSDRNE